jgi:hypothetical protein
MDRWNVAAKVAATSSAVVAAGLLLTGFFAWRAADRRVLSLQQASAQLDGNPPWPAQCSTSVSGPWRLVDATGVEPLVDLFNGNDWSMRRTRERLSAHLYKSEVRFWKSRCRAHAAQLIA